jgi:hypothetical protein
MATRRKNTVKKLKFELTRSAIGGISVVAFCLFLWMFLLGVWAGQSLLIQTPASSDGEPLVSELNDDLPVIRAEKKAKKNLN